MALNYYNRQLKRLAALVGLETGLSSYTSRHSWATAARNHEVPLPVISAGLGHTSEHTTRIYLDCLESSVIDRANRRSSPASRAGSETCGRNAGPCGDGCVCAAGAFPSGGAGCGAADFPGKPPDGAPRLRFISYICDDENRDRMKLTFLGTGTSQGVPVIGCRCGVCTSPDRRDRRLRTSAMVETRGVRLVIDAGPDFRYQMLRTGVRRLDAILLTHEHKDHIGGLDDVRAFNFVDYPPTVRKVDLYAAPRTAACVRKDFDYAFAQDKYRGVPEIELHEIDVSRPFEVRGVGVTPVSGHHSDRFAVTGYRIGPLAYLTDFKTIGGPRRRSCSAWRCWWSMRCASSRITRISTWRRRWS